MHVTFPSFHGQNGNDTMVNKVGMDFFLYYGLCPLNRLFNSSSHMTFKLEVNPVSKFRQKEAKILLVGFNCI
jgi:hypothetical protein